MAAQAAPDVEEDLLDALADGGLLNEQPEARPATAEETYIHHVGMRRATIFSGCLCGVRADPPSVIDATQVILALIITITFHVIWLTGEIPFIDPPVYCTNHTLADQKWHVTSSIHMIEGDNGVSYAMYVKYLALWRHVCENSLGKVVSNNVLRVHRLVLYSTDSQPPFSDERILLEANTTDRVIRLMDDELDQYVSEMPTLFGGPWSLYYDGCIYFFMDSPQSSAPPGLGALYVANLTSGKVQTLGAAGWNPAWVSKFGDVWINSTTEYMEWCHPFMFQTFPLDRTPYLLWGFNGGSGCHGSFSRWSSNTGLAPLTFGTNTTWNFGLTMGIMLPAAYNLTPFLTNWYSLPTGGIPPNATLARTLYPPVSSLPFYTPWDGNWTALFVFPGSNAAVLTAPSYWRTKFTNARCLLWNASRLSEPRPGDKWNSVLCNGYGGNIGRRGVSTGLAGAYVIFDPYTASYHDVTRPASILNVTPTGSQLGTPVEAVLWPIRVRTTNEFGNSAEEERPCVWYLGTLTCWEGIQLPGR